MKGTTIMESDRKDRQDSSAGRAFDRREKGENETKRTVLWVVQILASPQIYSLKSKNKKQSQPILQASVQEICKPGSSKYLAVFFGRSWVNTQEKVLCSSYLQCCGCTPLDRACSTRMPSHEFP